MSMIQQRSRMSAHRLGRSLALACSLLVAAALAGCADDPTRAPAVITDADHRDLTDDSGRSDVSDDVDNGPDTSPCDPAPGEFGAACDSDSDCFSNVCLDDPRGAYCTSQCVDACPVTAIFAEEDLPSDQQDWTAINAELSPAWPAITRKKPPPPDADQWAAVKNKREHLDRGGPRSDKT